MLGVAERIKAGLVRIWVALAVAFAAFATAGVAQAGSLSPDDVRYYRDAFAAAHKDRFDYARVQARKAHDKLLIKVLVWMDYIRPNSGASFADITAFIGNNPTWPQIAVLSRRAEEAITVATPDYAVLAWFDKHPPQTVDGAMAYGKALINAGRSAQATALLRDSWINGDFGPVQEHQFRLHFGDLIRPEDDKLRMDRLLWSLVGQGAQGEPDDSQARRQLPRIPAGDRPLAEARIALAKDAANAEALLAHVPESSRNDPGLLFERVHFLRDRGRDDQAIALMKSIPGNQARPDLWWPERAALARTALQEGHPGDAYAIAQDHGQLSGAPFAEAEWLSGWIELRFVSDPAGAVVHFTRMYDHVITPQSRARAAYWAGRAYEAAGQADNAKHWYTQAADYVTAFYGQLAASHLGEEQQWPLPADPLPSAADIESFEHEELAMESRRLTEIGETEILRPFVMRLIEQAKTPGERALAAQVAASSGRSDIAIAVARRSERDGIPLISTGYPLSPLPPGNRPERALLLGLIRQESAFHTAAISSAGARGLMQIMPATAAKIAKGLKLVFKRQKTLDSALTNDPSLNVRLGASYMDSLLGDFNGSYILSIAAYNAGPGRVRKWIDDMGDPRAKGIDSIDWIESIPYFETRNYVQRVLEGVQIYRRRLAATGLVLSLEGDLKR